MNKIKWAKVRKKTLMIRGKIGSCVDSSVGGRQENSLRTVRSNC